MCRDLNLGWIPQLGVLCLFPIGFLTGLEKIRIFELLGRHFVGYLVQKRNRLWFQGTHHSLPEFVGDSSSLGLLKEIQQDS